MNKWEDYFKIVKVDAEAKQIDENAWMWGDDTSYQLRDPDNNIIATYKDFAYAKKQAKYRFKKLQKRVENILLK